MGPQVLVRLGYEESASADSPAQAVTQKLLAPEKRTFKIDTLLLRLCLGIKPARVRVDVEKQVAKLHFARGSQS